MNFTASPLMVLFSSTFAFFKRKRLSSAKEREIKNKVKKKTLQDWYRVTSLFHPLQAWYERGGLENGYDFIRSVISLNPTVLFEDCDLCPAEVYDGLTYCICLVSELIDHSVPSLIFTGEVEINELPGYDGLLGQDIYDNTPETTTKMLFEVAGGGHGSSYESEPREKALQWAKYHLMGDVDICETLIEIPGTASDFQTTLSCNQQLPGDINGDTLVNVQDVILVVNLVLTNQYNTIADLNTDGSINVQDVVLILNLILE